MDSLLEVFGFESLKRLCLSDWIEIKQYLVFVQPSDNIQCLHIKQKVLVNIVTPPT